MDIKQMKYFMTVAEEGTITAAAKKLHISQPPLSAQMHLLEEELGCELFRRGARQITLTESGSILYKRAVEMVDLEAAAREEIRTWTQGRSGRLRLGLVSSSSSKELYDKLRLFRKAYPEIQIKAYEGNSYELLEELRKGRLDAAVLRTPFSGYGLETVPLRKDRMAAAGKIPAEKKKITLVDLAGEPLILYRRWEKIILDECEKEGISPHVYCVADDARTCLRWAREGLGTALVPESVLPEGEIPAAVLSEEALSSSLLLARRKGDRTSKGGELLFEICRNPGRK